MRRFGRAEADGGAGWPAFPISLRLQTRMSRDDRRENLMSRIVISSLPAPRRTRWIGGTYLDTGTVVGTHSLRSGFCIEHLSECSAESPGKKTEDVKDSKDQKDSADSE